MGIAEIVLCAVAVLTAGTAFTAVAATLLHYRRAPPPDDAALDHAFPAGRPTVSILKPCKGADPSLYDNLVSFVTQEGFATEVLIGIADPRDPAVEIARRVIADHPDRDVRLVITGDRHGFNPKVMNLAQLARVASGDFFWVADSNVRANPGLLRRLMVAFADPKVALSYAMFRGVPEADSVGARIQAAVFCTLGLPSITAAYKLFGIGNLVGKCFIVRETAFAALGGWARYERFLVEDGLIGRELAAAGHRAVLANEVVDVHLGQMSLPLVWAQEMRWSVLHKLAFPAVPVGELVWNPFVIGLAAAVAWAAGLPIAAGALAAAAGHNLLIDLLPLLRFGHRLRDAWLLVAADALMGAIVASVWFEDKVVWRGQRFTLGENTLILHAEPADAHHVAPEPEVEVALFGGGK